MADPLSFASEVLTVLELCDRVLAVLDQTPNATKISISSLDELRTVLEEFMLNLRAFVSLFEGNTSAFPRHIMEHFEKELRGTKQLLELFLREFDQLTGEMKYRPVTFQTQLWKSMRDLGSRVRTTTLSLDRLRQAVLVQVGQQTQAQMSAAKKEIVEMQRLADEAMKPSAPPKEEPQPGALEPLNDTDFPPLERFVKSLTSSQRQYFSRLVFEVGDNYSFSLIQSGVREKALRNLG
ncbi:hypothetical protein BDW75DRAFT_219011 [Aspergillus navahoensis]